MRSLKVSPKFDLILPIYETYRRPYFPIRLLRILLFTSSRILRAFGIFPSYYRQVTTYVHSKFSQNFSQLIKDNAGGGDRGRTRRKIEGGEGRIEGGEGEWIGGRKRMGSDF